MEGVSEGLVIGVLAVQGGFSEHVSHLERLRKVIAENRNWKTTCFEIATVRAASQLDEIDGLIIPGGETTSMSVFLQQNNCELLDALIRFRKLKPTFGTCAGLIMLANEVEGQMKTGQQFIGGMDIKVRRNHYGSQKQSFEGHLEEFESAQMAQDSNPTVFIRAPGITDFDSSQVQVLAKYNGSPVAVRQGHLLATSFHPELTENFSWHLYFLEMVAQHSNPAVATSIVNYS